MRLRRPGARRLPLAARRSLLTAFCLLLAAHCSLPTAHASWAKQRSGSFAWLHSVFFVDDERGWAVGSKGALLSTADGGATWETRKPPTEDAMRDLFFTDAQTGWVVCERSVYMPMKKDEARSYLLKTSDGGATWRRVEVAAASDVDIVLAGVRFADASRGWVFGEAGALYATSDGGDSWARQRVPSRHLLLGAAFRGEADGWLVGAGATLLQTSDGGATWRAGSLSIPIDFSSAGSASPSRAAHAGVAHSAAGGAPTRGPSLRLNAVSFADARRGWAVGGRGTVLATADGGRVWRAQSSGVEAELFDVKFFDEREGWAVGAGGTAIHTTDGGATWRVEPTGTTHALERLFFAGRGRGWAVGFGGTIIAFRR